MNDAPLNPWYRGGILVEHVWNGRPANMIAWDGGRIEVNPGDELLVLQMPAWVQLIGKTDKGIEA